MSKDNNFENLRKSRCVSKNLLTGGSVYYQFNSSPPSKIDLIFYDVRKTITLALLALSTISVSLIIEQHEGSHIFL